MNSLHGARPPTILSSFIQAALDAKRITLEALARKLKALYRTIQRLLEKIPPLSSAPGHARREEVVDRCLTDIASAIAKLATWIGMKQEGVTAFMRTLKPYVRTFIVALGDIHEKNPYFFPALAFIILVLVVPQTGILGLLGFGLLGPVAGTVAALMQSLIFGGVVGAGCWFAQLQAAGMGAAIPLWFGVVTIGPLVLAGLAAAILPFFMGSRA